MSARDVIAALAPAWITPPVLQPGALYLELSGEDIRARAFLVSDASDLCLRPDMTVPAVRAAFALPTPPADEGTRLPLRTWPPSRTRRPPQSASHAIQ